VIYVNTASSCSRFIAIILVVLFLPACTFVERLGVALSPKDSIYENVRESNTQVTAEKVIVRDLLSALVQIFPPKDTTVQVSSSNNTNIHQLVAYSIVQLGYGVQKVATDQGAMLVSVDLESEVPPEGNRTTRLRIGVGDTYISRSYEYFGDNAVQPTSNFRLYGTRSSIDVALTLFGATQFADSTHESIEYTAPIAVDEPLPVLSLLTPPYPQPREDDPFAQPEGTTLNSSNVEINNLFYSDSNFSSVLDEYNQVEQLVVIFPSDSIVMGDESKLLIRRFVERFVESVDIIGVVGCSNGPTASDLGNIGLAMGRAERVTDELLALGVPRPKILDEGCWAPRLNVQDFPGRGVVLSRYRTQS